MAGRRSRKGHGRRDQARRRQRRRRCSAEIKSELFFSAPVPTLVDLSKETQMVGCRGRGALRRGLLGSVSTGLIHHAHCPVAVIHDKVPSSMQPVLVGIDGSPASELATAIAFDEASWRGVDLVALHTWSDATVSDVPSQEWSAQQAAAEEPLAERITGWQDRYPDVSVEGWWFGISRYRRLPVGSTRTGREDGGPSSPNPLHCRDYRHRSAVLATPRTTLWPCRSSDAYDFAGR